MSSLASSSEELILHRRGAVQWAVFNRPAAYNAMTHAMEAGLTRLCRALNDEPEVRALVLIGAAGSKPAFMAGADMGDLADVGSVEGAIEMERLSEDMLTALENVRVPTIAAIAGPCVGVGALIASACDVRLASPSIRFGFPIARTVGNSLSAKNFARLVALLGPARTKEMVFSTRLLEAGQLASLGVLREVAPAEGLLEARAQAVAEELAALAPLTLWSTKETLRRLRDAGLDGADDDDLLMACYLSEDYRGAIAAFVEKRKPVFQGR